MSARILCCYVCSSRFDRTEHYVQCEYAATLAYLTDTLPDYDVRSLEYGLLGGPDRALARAIVEFEPHVVVFWCGVHEAHATRRAAALVRDMAPNTRILVWGDGPLWMPQYFTREPFDSVVVSGDPEAVLLDAVVAYVTGNTPSQGVFARAADDWRPTAPGALTPPDRWPLPDPHVIDATAYDAARSHRGKPGRDLSITVARGCAVRCAGCVDPLKSGVTDRRIPIHRLVGYFHQHAALDVTFQLHGPTFGADRNWCAQLAASLKAASIRPRFKCVTLTRHVCDEQWLTTLADAGLASCGVGIETLSTDGRRLERKTREAEVVRAAAVAERLGVRLTAYIQIGVPAQRRSDVLYTITRLRDLGYRLRPTGHTPFHRLRAMHAEQLDAIDLYAWDRKSYWEPTYPLSRGELLRLVAQPERFIPEAATEGSGL